MTTNAEREPAQPNAGFPPAEQSPESPPPPARDRSPDEYGADPEGAPGGAEERGPVTLGKLDDPTTPGPDEQADAETLRRRERAIETFLHEPVEYVHESWFETMPHGALLVRLAACARTREHVSRELLAHHAPEEIRRAELDDPVISALCLATPAALQDLVWHAGLVAGAGHLRRVLDGTAVRALREAIGDEGYRFALARAEFLAPEAELARLPELDLDGLPETVHRHGLRLLAPLCLALPSGLSRRLALKLPVSRAEWLAAPFELDEPPDARGLLERLLRERGFAR